MFDLWDSCCLLTTLLVWMVCDKKAVSPQVSTEGTPLVDFKLMTDGEGEMDWHLAANCKHSKTWGWGGGDKRRAASPQAAAAVAGGGRGGNPPHTWGLGKKVLSAEGKLL